MKEWTIQNEYFNLKLTEKGSIELLIQKSGRVWKSECPFCFSYGGNERTINLAEQCCMKVSQKDNSLKISFQKLDWYVRFKGHQYRRPDPGPDFKFSFKIEGLKNE